MPLAAYGGKRAIMEKVAPLGPVYQAGTLSGNPVAVSAALATLERLDDALYARLESLGARLEEGLVRGDRRSAARAACVQRVGSMITLFFAPGPVRSWDDAKACDTKRFGRWHGGDARARHLLAAVAVRGGVPQRGAHGERHRRDGGGGGESAAGLMRS